MLTPADKRAGLLVAVITGGRPELKQRPTRKFLADLKEAGFTNVCWVVAERDAHGYERDEHELVVYPDKWAEEYAASHWINTTPYEPGTFYGAFVGREYACLEAERRGCWGVLQLDDNITEMRFVRSGTTGVQLATREGRMVFAADVLAAVTHATNGRMVGAGLSSMGSPQTGVSRTGFPYSCFIERVGEGREHWYGPFEDDITHAYQYGTRAEPGTALVCPMVQYRKESGGTSGMRAHYNHERSVNLHRVFPESANIVAMATKSDGRREPGGRVFHKMNAGAIRNPQVITDREKYREVRDYLQALFGEYLAMRKEHNRQKVEKRAR